MHFVDRNNLRDLNDGVAHHSGHVTAVLSARAEPSLSGVSLRCPYGRGYTDSAQSRPSLGGGTL